MAVGFWVFSMDMPPKDMKQTTVFFSWILTVEMWKISKCSLICSGFSLVGWVTDHSENLAAELWRFGDGRIQHTESIRIPDELLKGIMI